MNFFGFVVEKARGRRTGFLSLLVQVFRRREGEARRGGIPLLLLSIFLPLIFMGQSPALAKNPSHLLNKADSTRHAFERSERGKKYRNNWLKPIRLYEDIYTRFPKNDEAAWALYQSGRLYMGLYQVSRREADLDEALSLFRRLTERHETHRLADDGQYLIGEIFYKYKDDPSQAYVEFLKVDIKYPSGDMRPMAKKKLDEVAVVLSRQGVEEREKKSKGKPLAGGSNLIPIKEIRHWSTPNYTRVVIDLDAEVAYTHHLLKPDPDINKPRRLYLDLKEAVVSSEVESAIPIKDGLLHRARAGQYTKDTVRVVLDIESLGGYKVFHLLDPFRIVVDVKRLEGKKEEETKHAAARRARRGVRKGTQDDTISLARQLGLSVKTIVIDPGHGGKDPGCFINGVKEKDVVLELAKLLAAKIKSTVGCEVILTRTTDIFLPLERRTAIANMHKADLFISLHINAHRNRDVHGLETYFLNMATDEGAVMVAARENATSEKNISDLQKILNDLMLNTKINESSKLAHEVHMGVFSNVQRRYRDVRDLGVKQAPFYVLIGAEMPAVLVEAGFLTNGSEANRLVSRAYKEKVADGICNGIKSYIKSIELVYQGG